MRKFAFYLPQFHEILENNEWWGEGFTEWINVKKATPLFKKHDQPKVPLNNNYYNLLEKSTVEWQTELMQKYKVDGLIYYHYYFTGKKLLEKPAENLLEWTDINQPFFFCWANHTWYRSWNNSKEVLIEQTYGKEKEWEEHFLYLLKFFKDARYEKKDNKPLLMIYDPSFEEKHDMFLYFDKRCKESGFSGISIIETYSARNWPEDLEVLKDNRTSVTDYVFLREPALSQYLYANKIKYSPVRVINKIKSVLSQRGYTQFVRQYDGNVLYDLQIEKYKYSEDVIHGAFFEWDNTPRHKERGYIITPVDKKHFMKYMDVIKDDEYVFFNAWNEWAEGMVMEPTVKDGYRNLEWIKEWSITNK